MNAMTRIEHALTVTIEQALVAAVAHADAPGSPPRLGAALRYAVFPGGARIRPRLCLAAACACGEDDTTVADAAAASIELLHCASLVHDDLPCFDDAPTRRGKPSVHRAFGEPLAVLSGDALIVLAFQTLARGVASAPHRLAPLLLIISRSVGMPSGIVAGQAWECESRVALADYQRLKTGALFAAATMAGAAAAGAEPGPWRTLGERLGEAYQVADDIRDVAADPQDLGKPIGRDVALDRPSAARELGLTGAIERFDQLVAEAADSIPHCSGAAGLRALIHMEAQRFLPKELAQRAA
jgi:geranylgeranyl diphosphate synthase type II